MAWHDGYASKRPLIDWNKKFLEELKGELDEDVARKTLGKFMMHNIGFTVHILTGFILEPYQRLTIKGWFRTSFALTVAGRGFSKSFLFSHFCYLYCLFNPNQHILMVSATFRSSRQIVENIDKWSNVKGKGTLLRQCIQGDMVKKQDLYRITFTNGASVTAVPLGNANNLRGFRCNVLGIDEGLLISPQTIELVLKPFLIAGADITKKQKIRRREDELIKAGKMKEDERAVFKSTSKMIILSSASYQWEALYDTYKKYLKIIYDAEANGENEEDQDSRYLVHQFSYEVAKDELIDPAIKRELKEGLIPQHVIDREYKAMFILESGGYFDAKKMAQCTVEDGKEPCLEMVGEPGAEYILAIDPNMSAADHADHFAMCVIKIVGKLDKDGNLQKKIGMVVHQYAVAGVELKFHIMYLLYILDHFNIVYLACDSTQGENMGFINVCNESEQFKSRKMFLRSIEAEFGKDNFDDLVKQARKSYNLTAKTIVQQQDFHSSFQRAANEHLKACFDFRDILFAAKAMASPHVDAYLQDNIGDIFKKHPEFLENDGEGSIFNFIENQDTLIDLVKKECSFINPTSTSLGNIVFDLPQSMKRNKDPRRNRKDSYSALLLGNWALKIYLAMMDLPKEVEEDNLPPPLLI